jgi:DNA polymerase I
LVTRWRHDFVTFTSSIMPTPTLLLVDGSSYLYRAFHALPDLRASNGQPTGAIRGVLSMLRTLLNDYPAQYRAVVFDAKGKTFRDDWYPEYKAQRPPMPEDLAAQIAPLHACIKAQGWPLLCVEGVEADDVIGTLARQAAALGINCVISTGDKDMAQLVDAHVTLVNTMSNEVLDVGGVQAKFGVAPERIVDYLTLIGDTVDNVPGVAKCGPKTAVKWLTQYGTLDDIISHASEIGGVVGENLRAHLGFMPMGRKLVTIVCDLSLPHAVTELVASPSDDEVLRRYYSELEFKGWLREVGGAGGAASSDNAVSPALTLRASEAFVPTSAPTRELNRSGYELILDKALLDVWVTRLLAAPLVALDTETDALDPLQARMVGMSFALREGAGEESVVRAAYLPLGHIYAGAPDQLAMDDALAALRPWLESEAHGKLGQHLKFDRHILANHGVRLRGVREDTLLASYVVESDKAHDLGSLAARHCGLKTLSYDDITGKGAARISFAQVAVERAGEYGAEDAECTLLVHEAFAPRLAAAPTLDALYRELELPVAEVLFRMERNGICLDGAVLNTQSHELGQQLMRLEGEVHALAGQPFNLNSPKQLGDILFGQMGLPVVKKTASGVPSTDEEVLTKLAEDFPLPQKLLEYRSLAKLKNTYTDKLPKMINPHTGRVHTSYGQAVAVTGRLSSNEPNLQNIPVRTAEGRRIRSAFIASPGCVLVSADYSQIELRIMAHLSNDARLLEAFSLGEDVHKATAGEVFGVAPDQVSSEQRRAAKAINFGLIYGMSAFGLAKQIGVDRSAAQTYMDRYFARYPGVARYMEETREAARQMGYVETVFGRRLWLADIRASNAGKRQGAERAAINAPMQGTAADLIKRAMLAVQAWLDAQGMASLLLLQVHDELILDVPQRELAAVQAALPGLMSGVANLAVPLLVEVGVGANWDAAH